MKIYLIVVFVMLFVIACNPLDPGQPSIQKDAGGLIANYQIGQVIILSKGIN